MSEENEVEVTDVEIEGGEEEVAESPEVAEGEDVTEPSEEAEAPAEERPKAKVEFTPEQQAVFDAAISKKAAKTIEARKENERLQNEIKELQAKLPKQGRPELPPLPDQYSDSYEKDMQDYTEAVRKQVAYDDNIRQQGELQKQQQTETLRKQQEELEKTAISYTERSEKLGISREELGKAGVILGDYAIANDVAKYIMQEPVGPQISVYLSRHLDEAEEVFSMSPALATAYIAEHIKPKAAGVKKKIDLPPDPPEHLNGRGAPESDGGPAGVIYE